MMKNLLLAVLALAPLGTARAGKLTREEISMYNKREDWHTTKMEATAIMGEIKYQRGDLEEARDTFHDSINSSTKLVAPGSQVMGLDLYRTAELAARRGDFKTAKERLDILMSRYPDSEFAKKGAELLGILPKGKADDEDDDLSTPVMTAELPELVLSRLQAALKAGRDQEALDACADFASRFPEHKSRDEVLVAEAATYLRLSQPERAAGLLKAVIARSADAALRARAVHLLGAADAELGDWQDILSAVPSVEPAQSWSPWIARAQVWRALALEKTGRGKDAGALYAKISATGMDSPVRAYAMAGMAGRAAAAGLKPAAQAAFAKAAELGTRYGLEDFAALAALARAGVLYRMGLFKEAAAAYGDFVARRPQDPSRGKALFQQGLCFKRLGKGHDAAASFSRLVEEMPDSAFAADAHLQLGQLYETFGAHSAAVDQYQEMAKAGGKDEAKESLLLRAQVHYNAKRYKDAIPLYLEYLRQNPEDARAREVQELLLTSYWMGDRENPGFGEALSRYPDHAIVKHARWELAASAYRRQDFQKAQELLALYASDYPKDAHAADALFFQGEALMKTGEPERAAGAYRALAVRFPKDPRAAQAAVRLGAALYDAKDYEGSAAAYNRAAKAGGKAASDALYSKGLSLLKGLDKPGALSAFEDFLKKYPKARQAASVWFEVARLREELGRPADAAFAYASVPAGDANRVEALYSAARLREKLKQPALALRNYQQLVAARPASNPMRLRGLLRLGLIYELKGKPAKAMPLYAEILRLAPHDGKDYDAARRRVEALNSKRLVTLR